jgi:hypothetical protein
MWKDGETDKRTDGHDEDKSLFVILQRQSVHFDSKTVLFLPFNLQDIHHNAEDICFSYAIILTLQPVDSVPQSMKYMKFS